MRAIPDHLLLQEAALVAGALACEATAELLRYAREGEWLRNTAFSEETVAALAEALFHAIAIEGGPIFDVETHPADFAREARLKAALADACRAYVEERDE